MPRTHLVVALALLIPVAAAIPALGTTYVPVSDGALVERAVVIGTFEVLSSDLAPTARLTTEYRMRVDTLLKGDLPGGLALVRVPGGEGRDGGLRFTGLPNFLPGERALLFLVPRRDGAWGIAHIALGAFRQLERAEGDLLLRPHLLEARSVDRAGQPAAADGSVARDGARFLRWIADRVGGRNRAADYFVPVDAAALVPRFTVFRDPSSGNQLRWFDFDGGDSVVWRSADPGPVGYTDKGVAAVQAGLRAWSNLTQSTIELQYAGLGAVDPGFEDADGVNTVLFDDPNQELDDPFDCSEGGVVAIGGPFYVTQTFNYKNQSWYPIIEGVVITNAELSCFLRGNTTRLAEVLGHELGHTLGFGHSCGSSSTPPCSSFALDDALMRATVHNDNRGARLGSDDMAAGRALYGTAGSSDLPKAPNKLAVQLAGDDATLQWNDRSNNELGFRVYRRLGAGAFTLAGQTGANQTTFVDSNLANGSWSWEVRAFNASGEGEPSNPVTAVVEVGTPGSVRLAQTDFYGSEASKSAVVTLERFDGKTGALQARLRTSDLSASAPLDYESKDVVVTWASGEEGAKVVTITIIDDFAAEDAELVEVLLETVPAAGQTQGSPLGSAAVAIADNDGSPGCAAGDRRLCLLGGRFKVEVEWRNQRDGVRGVGHALTGSDQSGYFWFFQSENVELIVKVLDGRPITGAHWLFYGGLSDVEYWVTVTDTANGERKLYRNPPGSICGLGDTSAFPEGGTASTVGAATAGSVVARAATMAVPATATGAAEGSGLRALAWMDSEPALLTPREACVPNAQTLCLLGGRFKVEVNWRDHRSGALGSGTASTFSDQTGFFWFFDAANIELVVKVLDGQGVNGNFWFFYGALSDVEYTIKVTDTATLDVHSYNNAGGNICGVGDIAAFPGD